jgi:hypothetical protein
MADRSAVAEAMADRSAVAGALADGWLRDNVGFRELKFLRGKDHAEESVC